MGVIFLGVHSRDNNSRRCESHCQAAGPRLEVDKRRKGIEMFFCFRFVVVLDHEKDCEATGGE